MFATQSRPASRTRRLRPRFEAMEGRQLLATFTVTSLADSGPGTLRAEILKAAVLAEPNTIGFAPGLTGVINLTTPLPKLTGDLTIAGPGADRLTVRSAVSSGLHPRDYPDRIRVFYVASGTLATLSGLTIESPINNWGGGILNEGTLSLADSSIRNCRSFHEYFLTGQAIMNTGTCTIIRTTISDCQARYGGTAVYNEGSMTIIAGAIVAKPTNIWTYLGIAIKSKGSLNVFKSTIATDAGDFGSLISIDSGAATFVEGTIQAPVDAWIFDQSASAGIHSAGTIFAGGQLDGTRITSFGNNLFQDPTTVRSGLASTDLVGVDPLLGPLGNYGGPTQTLPLLPGSPAIDAGLPGTYYSDEAVDQRGVRRNAFGTAVDIGAFESRGFAVRALAGDLQSAQHGTAFARPLIVAVTSPYGEPVAGGLVTFAAPNSSTSARFSNGTRSIITSIDTNGLATSGRLTAYAPTLWFGNSDTLAATASTAGVRTPAQFRLRVSWPRLS